MNRKDCQYLNWVTAGKSVRTVLQPRHVDSDCPFPPAAYHGGSHIAKETMMPSNQEYKGRGMKGRNYDELSGVGTSRAGQTGTVGNLNDAGHDGGVGAPDQADEGNLQSARPGEPERQPDTTPAQGDSWRGYAGNKQSGGQGSQQSGQAEQLRGSGGDRQRARKQESQDDIGTADPSER
jgi:hypothetical protein